MNYKKHIITIAALLIVNFCQAQYDSYDYYLFPKIKKAFKLLYPYASDVLIHQTNLKDSTQLIRFKCNCQDSSSAMEVLFNAKGDRVNKSIVYASKTKLPDTIRKYIDKDTSLTGYSYIQMTETITKDDKSYLLLFYQIVNGPMAAYGVYLLKFKSTGELISKEKRMQNI